MWKIPGHPLQLQLQIPIYPVPRLAGLLKTLISPVVTGIENTSYYYTKMMPFILFMVKFIIKASKFWLRN
jgi:hypothetical protein